MSRTHDEPDRTPTADAADEASRARPPRLRDGNRWTWLYRWIILALLGGGVGFSRWVHDELESNGRSIAELRAMHEVCTRLLEEQAVTIGKLSDKVDRLVERRR